SWPQAVRQDGCGCDGRAYGGDRSLDNWGHVTNRWGPPCGAGGPATAARGPNEQLLDCQNRAVHLQLRRPRRTEERRLGRRQEQSGPDASTPEETRPPG